MSDATPARTLSVTSAAIPMVGGRPALVPIRLSGTEGINRLGTFELALKTPDSQNGDVSGAADFSLDDFVGRELTVSIQLDGMGAFEAGAAGASTDAIGAGTREITALITHAALWGEEGRHVQYRLALRPWLYLATLRVNCRIFQNQTVIQVLDALLADYAFPVEKRLIETFPVRDYQTQFNETDFAFFERLCQEWGINYFFEHAEGKSRLVLIDNIGAHRPNPSAAYSTVEYHAPGWKTDAEYVHSFVPESQLTSGAHVSRDYDYTRPKSDLTVRRVDPRPTGQANQEDYRWHASEGGSHYAQPNAGTGTNEPLTEGDLIGRLRMQALRTEGMRARASGNLRAMVPGCTFALTRHPRQDANTQYLVLLSELVIEEIGQDSQPTSGRRQAWRVVCDFEAHPLTEPLRPRLSRVKPHTHGPQVALVVGPEGQNVWTDELGRIKVQFPWDRQGARDQDSSCWVRVSSPWAGNQLGGVQLPRIGQEVVVDFIGGDPDLPLCTGRVHNQMNLPPWALPAQSALSGFRSRELTPRGGNASSGRSNHLVLDDTARKIQAQLKSDHQSSSLSLGHITRIEDNAGRKDARGEGFELRTDAHGAIRARQGLLITTEERTDAAAHAKDMGETVQRLTQARGLHQSAAQIAQQNKAQESADQAAVATVLQAQNDAVKGTGSANPAEGQFPELGQPHLVLASPAGIQTTTQFSTHLASAEHTAVTSGRHTSLVSGDSLLAVALQAVKIFAAQKGIQVTAAQADIDLQALTTSVNVQARKEITLKADKITIEATSELRVLGGGSYTHYVGGGIESATSGSHVRHAANHAFVGPSSASTPSLPNGSRPGKGQLDLTHIYSANMEGLKGAGYSVTDTMGQVKTGTLDAKGFAAVSGLAAGGVKILFGDDPRNPWDDSSYIGKDTWPEKKGQAKAEGALGGVAAPSPGSASASASASSMVSGLLGKAAGGAGGGAAGIGAGLLSAAKGAAGAELGKAATGLLGGSVGGMAGGVASGAVSGNFAGAAQGALGQVAKQALAGAGGAAGGAAGGGAVGAALSSALGGGSSALGGAASHVLGGAASTALASLAPGILPASIKT